MIRKIKKCPHGKQKHVCKYCGGNSLCKHNRQKHTCIECRGASVCEHRRLRYSCKDCGGNSFCEHNRLRTSCRECRGGGRCKHNIIRATCRICAPLNWAKRLLQAANKRAIEKRYKPPQITPEGFLLLLEKAHHCVGCSRIFTRLYGRNGVHLHHSHATGEVYGLTHASCNHVEGHLRAMPIIARRRFLRTFFPEVFKNNA